MSSAKGPTDPSLGAARPVNSKTARIPRGMRVYVVGDIHGRADLLSRLLEIITADSLSQTETFKLVIYLGDYVDRGANSKDVLNIVRSGSPLGFEKVHLMGNHEFMMLRFLYNVAEGPNWLACGGGATLQSYGVKPSFGLGPIARIVDAQRRLQEKISMDDVFFLSNLRLHYTLGDYLFVHAGIRPGIPLDRQRESDLMWIREDFLHSTIDHGKVVVHGHTITHEPEVEVNRIGLDTGAYATGRLTCLVLEGARRYFLHT